MNSSIFNSKKFYIISSNDTDIKSILIDAGAIYQSYLSESLSFAISDNSSESEVGEADELYNVAVVTSEWIRLCFLWGKCRFIKVFHPGIRNLFSKLIFHISNVNSEDSEKLKGYIRIYGGSISCSINKEVSHVIIGVIEGEMYDKVVSQCSEETVLVTPNWVVECVNVRNILPATSFHPQILFEKLKQLQIVREIERVSQTKKPTLPSVNEPSKRQTCETSTVQASQFGFSGLQQAVPISIQDSLLTRQLPSTLSRPEPPVYQASRPPITIRTNTPANTTVPTSVPSQSPATKNKTSKSNNKHLQEQGLNESEKDAIVMQNVMSILGQSHPRRSSTVTASSDKSTVSVNNKKPRSPRMKSSSKFLNMPCSSSAPMSSITKPILNQSISQQATLSSTPIIQINSSSLPQTQLISSIISTPVATSSVTAELRLDPTSPKIDNNSVRPVQQQNQQISSNIAAIPRFGMVCGPTSATNPQSVCTRPQTLTQDIEKIVYNPSNLSTTPSSGAVQQLIAQQSTMSGGLNQSLYPRKPQNQMQQMQQQIQQHKQLITIGQIQTPGHQIQQHWQNAVHMSPNQHTSPAILSPGGLCANVTGNSVQQGAPQMYQLTNQQTNYYRWMNQLTRNGIINNGNQVMLNNLSNGMPINAQCASMVTNVPGPLHLQSPIGNGNPATLMLHQQQLHVTGNLSSSAMQSPVNVSSNSNLCMTPGKLLTNQCARSILQHPSQISQVVRVTNPSNSVLQTSNQGIVPTNVNGEHVHHHNNAHLSRPFPGLLRLPQYVGHEGITMNICRENCLIGCVFYLYGYEDVNQLKRDNWLLAIRNHGGETVNVCNFQNITHLIVDYQLEDPDLFKLALRNKTRVVTIYWVNDVIEKGHLEPPFEIIHLPSPFSKNLSFSYIRKQIVSITGFEGEERKKVEYMVIQLGVKYTEYLEVSNTVLICKKPSGRKYEAAQKLGIACVNVRWLQDLYFGDLQTLSSDIDHKYQCFEPSFVSIRLERHTHRVQELMVGWLTPIRLDEYSWKQLRILKDQCEAEKISKKRHAEANNLQSPVNSKKPKWDLPSLSEEDRKLADITPIKYSKMKFHSKLENGLRTDIKQEEKSENVDEFLQQFKVHPPVVIAFTGLLPEQRDKLTDLVVSLGGEVTEDMNLFTHLVAKSIVRTPKFYFGILRGCQIVTIKWIQACVYRQQFIDEKFWKLKDKEGELQYGFSLQESLARAQSRQMNQMKPLFDSLEFFLSPRAKHRQVCIDLIRACGGTIREKRPIQKMALMPEPKHLIICHEDDSHLANYLTRTKTGNKAVHHEEFVLSGVMRQELDYYSYQIQYVSVMKNAYNNHTALSNSAEHNSLSGQQDFCLGRCSPSRSVKSDSTVETANQACQLESYEQEHAPTNQKMEHLQFIVKSEPSIQKYPDSNIFSKIGFPAANVSTSYSMTNNNIDQLKGSSIETEKFKDVDQMSKKSISDIKVEESVMEPSEDKSHINSSMIAAEAVVMYCKDQIVTISSPSQEVFGMKVDETAIHGNVISSSMVPINLPDKYDVASVINQHHQSGIDEMSELHAASPINV